VVHKLIKILNRKLRSVGVGSNVQTATQVEQGDIGKHVQTRILEISGWEGLVKAVEARTEFIRNVCRKGVELAKVQQIKANRNRRIKSGQLSTGVDPILLVVNETCAQL